MRALVLSLLIGISFYGDANELQKLTNNNKLIIPSVIVISNSTTKTKTRVSGYQNKSGRLIDQGRPNKIFAGAKLNKKIPKLNELKKLFKQNTLLSMGQYINQSEEISRDEYKKRQAPSGEDLSKLIVNNKFKIEEKGGFVILKPEDKFSTYPSIFFKESDRRLKIVGLKFKKEVVPAKLVNYSYSKNKNASSYLIEVRERDGNTVFEYLFRLNFLNTVNKKVELANTYTGYSYLYGGGVKVRWAEPQNINLSLCGSFSPKEKARYKTALLKAVKKWNDNTNINITTKAISYNYPAINDLDTQCVYVIKGFALNKTSNNPGTPAFVSPVGDLDSRQLIDADLVIFDDYYNYYEKMLIRQAPTKTKAIAYLNKVLTNSLVHEIGHFLGLAHEFGEGQSIMSYELDRALSRHDIEAVNNLYSGYSY